MQSLLNLQYKLYEAMMGRVYEILIGCPLPDDFDTMRGVKLAKSDIKQWFGPLGFNVDLIEEALKATEKKQPEGSPWDYFRAIIINRLEEEPTADSAWQPDERFEHLKGGHA